MHDSRVIANRFLDLARRDKRALTIMQVLKLVYIAHGWMLGLYRRPLIADPIEAWRYGPVVPALYEQLRHFGARFITDRLSEPLTATPIDAEEQQIIVEVFERYGDKTGVQLSSITHTDGSPWATYYRAGLPSLEIPQDIIEDYYVDLAKAGEREHALV